MKLEDKKYALITGATSGIGRAFAKQLGKKGYNLIITGRRKEILEEFKRDLTKDFGIEVILIIGDFEDDKVIDEMIRISQNKNLYFLINNVGYGNKDGFFQGESKESLKMIDVHVGVTVRLCRELIPLMPSESIIINVSSLAAFLPTGYNHIYAASKNFLVSFTKSLSMSLDDKRAFVLLPGFTQSDFHRYTETSYGKLFWMTAEEVVSYTLKNIKKNKVQIIPGIINKIIYKSLGLLPEALILYILKKQKSL